MSPEGSSALLLEEAGTGLELPQFLERPRGGAETYGTLYRTTVRSGDPVWEIHGDPQAVIMAKRLFPGSEGRGLGVAKFPVTPRTFADLVWFLQRWPMRIDDPEAWEKDYRGHRMGLKDSLLCYYLVSLLGTDPDMQEALGLKISQFVGLMGDKWESEEEREIAGFEVSSHMQKVLAKLREMKGAA